jgi:hypothetical protein
MSIVVDQMSFKKKFIYFIHLCNNVWVISPPLTPTPSLTPTLSLSLTTPSLPGRNYFALISNFVGKRV